MAEAVLRSIHPAVNGNIPEKRGYRDPDAINGGTWEAGISGFINP